MRSALSLLGTEQPQFPQSLLRLVFSSLHQTHCSSLDMLEQLSILLAVRSPKLSTPCNIYLMPVVSVLLDVQPARLGTGKPSLLQPGSVRLTASYSRYAQRGRFSAGHPWASCGELCAGGPTELPAGRREPLWAAFSTLTLQLNYCALLCGAVSNSLLALLPLSSTTGFYPQPSLMLSSNEIRAVSFKRNTK